LGVTVEREREREKERERERERERARERERESESERERVCLCGRDMGRITGTHTLIYIYRHTINKASPHLVLWMPPIDDRLPRRRFAVLDEHRTTTLFFFLISPLWPLVRCALTFLL
jgi:hypothetical protein